MNPDKHGFLNNSSFKQSFLLQRICNGKALLLADSRIVKQFYQALHHTYTKPDMRQTQASSAVIPSAGGIKAGTHHCLQRRKNVSNLLSILHLAHPFHTLDAVKQVVVILAVHSLELW